MWEYAVATNVRPDNYHTVCAEYGSNGWTLEESNHYRVPVPSTIAAGGALTDARWDLVFRKVGGQSLPELHMNNAYAKLREVRDALQALPSSAGRVQWVAIADDIDKFIFKGSPGDM